MAYFYRYTDVNRDANDVKDMQLSSSYGDLSDGGGKAIKVNPGINDSNIGLFQFPVAQKYKFGEGEIAGFSWRFTTMKESPDVDAKTNLQGNKTFGTYLIYLMDDNSNYIEAEGNVAQLGEGTAYTMSNDVANNTAWYPMDLAAYLTSLDYVYPGYNGMKEDFEGISDVDVEIDVTQGAIRKKGDPYLDLDFAHKAMPKQAAGIRLAKGELSLFYGTDFKGKRIITLKPNGSKKYGPLVKKGEGGGGATLAAMGLTSAPATARGGRQGLQMGQSAINKNQQYQGYVRPGAGKAKFAKYTGGMLNVGTGGTRLGKLVAGGSKVAPVAKFGIKKVPVVGTAITVATAVLAGSSRAKSIKNANGDASGLSRPLRDPVWYKKSSYTNRHVGEKSVEGHIKYSYEEILNPVAQKDTTACTVTSTWWDQVQERQDYPKSEVTTDGVEISYVGNEDMMAKSAINFSTEDSIAGQSMMMRSYCDYDANTTPREQEAVQFNCPSGSTFQDIFVSKRLPCPKQYFGTSGGDDSSNARNNIGNNWELAFDMKISNNWTPYTAFHKTGLVYANTLRRCIAVTMSTLKPADGDDLQSYLHKHTDGAGAWTTTPTSKIAGFYIMPDVDFSNKTATKLMINPISTYWWNGSAVQNNPTIEFGRTNMWGNDTVTQTSLANGAYGTEVSSGKWLRFKLHTSPQGASGRIANSTGADDVLLGNKAAHQGRFWLTIHDTDTDEIISPTTLAAADDPGYGTTRAGPLNLTSPNDPIDAFTLASDDAASNSAFAINLGRNTGDQANSGTTAGGGMNHAVWTPYFTIWVANQRWNVGGSTSASEMLGSGNGTYKHDVFQKASLNSATATNALTGVYLKNATLSDMKLFIDSISLKGAEMDVVNLSVNDENLTPGSENIFNKHNTKLPKYYDHALGTLVGNSKFYQETQGTSSFSEDVEDTRTLTGMPTMLSLGFTKVSGDNFLNHDGVNSGDCSATKPSFFLLNDFVTDKELPPIIPDTAMVGMYTRLTHDRDRLCGDPIDLLGTLGTSKGKNPFHANGAGYLTVGNTAGNDIVTGTSEPDAFDANRGNTHQTMVNNFQQKGFIQVQKDLTGGSTDWMRRENVYAATHIIKLDEVDDKQAIFQVAQPDVLYQNTTIEGQPCAGQTNNIMETGTNLFILFQYGRLLHFGDPVDFTAGGNGITNGTCAVGTIEREENTITFTKITSHVTQNASDEWRGATAGASDAGNGVGGGLNYILKEQNLPRCMISPYRRWLILQFGIGPLGAAKANKDALDELPQRGYGSIVPVKRPDVAGNADANSGFRQGPTFNESVFYVNSSDQTPYFNRRSFEISGETPYHKNVDFGTGAYDDESTSGGEVTEFRPDYGKNEINLDSILTGVGDYSERFGQPLSFLVTASGVGTTEQNALFLHSANSATTTSRPKLITKFWDDPPSRPGLVVNPADDNAYYPEFTFAMDGSDLWHGFLMISEDTIKSKYDNLIAYAPLDENLDKWRVGSTRDLTVTPRQIKCYNHMDFIGKDMVGETTIGNLQGKLTYATDTALYNGTRIWDYADDTCEGLAGHAKLNDGYFLYGLYPTQVDNGFVPNTKSQYLKHFSAQGIFTFSSAMTTSDYSMIQHQNNAGTQPVWQILYDGTNKLIKARVWDAPNASSAYVELAATTAPLLDDVTPYHVCLVFDSELLEGNAKLYINGKLEDQTGQALPTQSINNWEYGNLLRDNSASKLHCGKGNGYAPVTINWIGKMEDILIHHVPIYPVAGDAEVLKITKHFEEVASNTSGETKVWNARLFVQDYHNFKGSYIAASNNISWRKPSFNIDGT